MIGGSLISFSNVGLSKTSILPPITGSLTMDTLAAAGIVAASVVCADASCSSQRDRKMAGHRPKPVRPVTAANSGPQLRLP